MPIPLREYSPKESNFFADSPYDSFAEYELTDAEREEMEDYILSQQEYKEDAEIENYFNGWYK